MSSVEREFTWSRAGSSHHHPCLIEEQVFHKTTDRFTHKSVNLKVMVLNLRLTCSERPYGRTPGYKAFSLLEVLNHKRS